MISILGNILRRRWDANQIEVSKFVISYEFTLALENLHFDNSLAVCSSQEDLRFLGRDSRAARDELSHDAAKYFDTSFLNELMMWSTRRYQSLRHEDAYPRLLT